MRGDRRYRGLYEFRESSRPATGGSVLPAQKHSKETTARRASCFDLSSGERSRKAAGTPQIPWTRVPAQLPSHADGGYKRPTRTTHPVNRRCRVNCSFPVFYSTDPKLCLSTTWHSSALWLTDASS